MKGLVGLSKCESITCPKLLHVNQVTPPGFEPGPPDPETDALTTYCNRLTVQKKLRFGPTFLDRLMFDHGEVFTEL